MQHPRHALCRQTTLHQKFRHVEIQRSVNIHGPLTRHQNRSHTTSKNRIQIHHGITASRISHGRQLVNIRSILATHHIPRRLHRNSSCPGSIHRDHVEVWIRCSLRRRHHNVRIRAEQQLYTPVYVLRLTQRTRRRDTHQHVIARLLLLLHRPNRMPPCQTLSRCIRRQLGRTTKWRLCTPRTRRSRYRITVRRYNMPRNVTTAQSRLHRPRDQRTTTQHPDVLPRHSLRSATREGTTEYPCH